MIGKLKGTVDEIGEDHAVIDVHGVGYVAFCPARTLGKLNTGEAAILSGRVLRVDGEALVRISIQGPRRGPSLLAEAVLVPKEGA